jgi:RNA polymerase sigma-70 factor (ECF subfamily)
MEFKQTQPSSATAPVRFTEEARGRLTVMFEAHHESVWRMLCRRGIDPEGAADLVQQAYLIAAQRLEDIRPGCERAFLLETGLRLARSMTRKLNRVQFEEDMDLHAGPASRAEELLDQQRALALMDRVLATLGADLLEVFLLFEMEHLPMREIAAMLNIPLGTVASRLRRAREAFREEAARLERTLLNRRNHGSATV